MSAYPSLPISEGYEQTWIDGRVIDRSADGLARIRKLHPDRAQFTLQHPALSTADATTLESHYSTNSALTFSFTTPRDGVTYTVAYSARPTFRLLFGGRKTYTVRLTQTD